MEDLIKRSDALGCFHDWVDDHGYVHEADEMTEYEEIASLPSALQKPHGRLIDADALLSLLGKCMFPSDMVTTSAVGMATNWIKDAPTIIPAEEGE